MCNRRRSLFELLPAVTPLLGSVMHSIKHNNALSSGAWEDAFGENK
jgi:hypothetical protein